jgi:ubiquinone/menaquinone biosynthesis C-methylase UbiE
MSQESVRSYYDQYGEREWERLTRPADGAIELAVNQHTIARYLPTAATVLDIGGGPGRYTIWLAEQGHRVTLADLSPALLEIARREVATAGVEDHIDAIIEADARDLSRWADGTFDAVLALGPFYHLPEPHDRERAAAELARVLRPGGLAFIALMPRLMFLRRTIALTGGRHLLTQPGFVDRVLEHGVYFDDRAGRFTGGYGVRPDEVEPFFSRHGLAQLTLLASESIVPDLQEQMAALATSDPETYQAVLGALIRTAAEPSILGMSNHLLYVGQKAAGQ